MSRIKQLLLLGGFVEIISQVLACFASPVFASISVIVFLAFIITAIIFLFKRRVEWAHRFAQDHTVLTPFLYAIGWIPYFSIPNNIVALIVVYQMIAAVKAGVSYDISNLRMFQVYLSWYSLVVAWGGLVCLFLATVYVLRNFYLAYVQKSKVKGNAKNEPGKQEIRRVIPAKAQKTSGKNNKKTASKKAKSQPKKEPGKKGVIRRAQPAKAKPATKNGPVKKKIERARPTKAKPVAKKA